MRVVSLIPSSTEIVCALGQGVKLVARSHECDFPAWVERLPALTAPKYAADGTSYEIDQRVKAIVSEGLAVYRVDAALLESLAPDVIITQSQCEVCAVSLRDVEAAVCQLVSSKPRIVAMEPNSLDDVWRDIRRVAEALDVPDRGHELVGQLRARVDGVALQTAKIAARPSLACLEWIDPLMAAGNWMPSLVERAGGINLFGEAGKHSPWLKFEELVARDPDVIALMPCGFGIDRARRDLPLLTARPEWQSLSAVRNHRVFICDGNQYFNRPGPRVVESLEILAEILHPEHFSFGHEGAGWQRVTAAAEHT